MSETLPTPSAAASAALDQLSVDRTRGRWILLTALGTACLWGLAASAGAIAWLGWDTIAQAESASLIAGLAAILLPGLILILAALIVRQTQQTAAANELILAAAARLVSPLDSSGEDLGTFADQVREACGAIDRAMNQSLAALKAMAAELGDERHRLESVTYASADNARDLADRLGAERARLEMLARELQAQTAALRETIPQQANHMLGAVRAAVEDISRSGTVLDEQLSAVNASGQALASRVGDLETLSNEAVQRNETLLFALAQIDEKLVQSGKIIEAASRSSEHAVAAAGTMGDRLVEAVKTAIDTARQASAEIQQRTLEASEAAATSLAQLKSAGQETSAVLQAVRASGTTASPRRKEAGPVSGPAPDTHAPEPEARPTPLDNDIFDAPRPTSGETGPVQDDHAEATVVQAPPSRAVEEDLFEHTADRLAATFDDTPDTFDLTDNMASEIDAERSEGAATIIDADFSEPAEPSAPANSLSDIIADMERQEHAPMSREETALALVNQLMDSGIRLPDIFRPREKKKAALASRKGDKPRRSAINQSVGRQVDRVRKRLRNDGTLMMLARDFVAHEQTDALNALENTHSTQKNASARLAAFLLVDAALA